MEAPVENIQAWLVNYLDKKTSGPGQKAVIPSKQQVTGGFREDPVFQNEETIGLEQLNFVVFSIEEKEEEEEEEEEEKKKKKEEEEEKKNTSRRRSKKKFKMCLTTLLHKALSNSKSCVSRS
jgi:hypothetical protein